MQKLAVVYFPKINVGEINFFRKKYDPLWNIIPPHITVVFPFSNIPEKQIIQHLDTVTKNIEPFRIHLNGLMKSFDDYLFLLVQEGKEEIERVHDTLHFGILTSHLRKDIPFIPHITLGVFKTKYDQLDKELYEKAFAEAKELDLDIQYEFNSLSLIKGDELTPAKTIKTFELK